MSRKINSQEERIPKFQQFCFNKGFTVGKDEGRVEGRAEGIMEGIAEGEIKAVLKFIRNQRNRHTPEFQILEDLQLNFELDEETARQYMAMAAEQPMSKA